MAKKQKVEIPKVETLTVECLCGGDEMIFSTNATAKGFRKFFCPTCHSTLWMSPPAFQGADANKKIMER
jgi:RNase P subunit RPR2